MITGLVLAIPSGFIAAAVSIALNRGPVFAFVVGGVLSALVSILCHMAGLP